MLLTKRFYWKMVACRPGESTLLLAAGLAGIAIVESESISLERQRYANGTTAVEQTSELRERPVPPGQLWPLATFDDRSTGGTRRQQTRRLKWPPSQAASAPFSAPLVPGLLAHSLAHSISGGLRLFQNQSSYSYIVLTAVHSSLPALTLL